jgi:hypothetical protein
VLYSGRFGLCGTAPPHGHSERVAVWFLASPVFGGIFGALIYAAFLSGLVAVSPSQSRIENIALPLFLTALAGFGSEWAKDLLTSVQDAIIGKK